LVKFASGVAEKNRTRLYLLAEHRKKPQAPLRRLPLRKKVPYATLFCCVKTLALRCVALQNGGKRA